MGGWLVNICVKYYLTSFIIGHCVRQVAVCLVTECDQQLRDIGNCILYLNQSFDSCVYIVFPMLYHYGDLFVTGFLAGRE